MNLMLSTDNIRSVISPILNRYGVVKAGLFGSIATGKADMNSDVDLLVELNSTSGLFDFIDMKIDLEKALGRKVDLVEYRSLKQRIRRSVLDQEIPVYG